MICPLCGQRKARRSCPALDKQICAVCCGTKRIVEIRCPASCGYLAAAREHPAAAVLREQQRDVALLVHYLRDLSERQAELFLTINGLLLRQPASDLQRLFDDDVIDAAGALASTFETASRGVIYEHRPASIPAGRLASALKPLLAEAGGRGGSSFERDAAVVLRRVAEAAREASAATPGNGRAYLDFLARLEARHDREREAGNAGDAASDRPAAGDARSRLIVP